jgi:isochorismate synthase EntC
MLNKTLTEDEEQILKDALVEISKEYDTMTVARDQIKEILVDASEKLDVPAPLLRKLSRLYHKKNGPDFESESGAIIELYEKVAK